jgi:hypothetical protein
MIFNKQPVFGFAEILAKIVEGNGTAENVVGH